MNKEQILIEQIKELEKLIQLKDKRIEMLSNQLNQRTYNEFIPPYSYPPSVYPYPGISQPINPFIYISPDSLPSLPEQTQSTSIITCTNSPELDFSYLNPSSSGNQSDVT